MSNEFELDIEKLTSLRHQLHKYAELSNQERQTANILTEFLASYKPDNIWTDLGGHGILVEYKGSEPGLNIGFRADTDALPIDESIHVAHGSLHENVSHKCGHDGHMTMVCALATYLENIKDFKGAIYLLFQPAEETGEGAERMITAMEENQIKLDYLFGLHNLPGFEKGSIVSKEQTFAAASKGMVIKLYGQTSHAAEPENGLSPVLAVANIIAKMTEIHKVEDFSDLTLATVIHTKMGDIAFGTTPGYAEIRITLRAMVDSDMKKLTQIAEDLVDSQSKENKLSFDISYTESFPATENNSDGLALLKEVSSNQNLSFQLLTSPFKWSEDFGHYKNYCKTAFFGLGAGVDLPMLHHKIYDFPDEIIPYGVNMYIGIIEKLLKNG